MASYSATFAHIGRMKQADYRARKRAYGAHRQTTPAQRAADVARSIVAHNLDVEAVQTWARYGLEANEEQQVLVRTALHLMRYLD